MENLIHIFEAGQHTAMEGITLNFSEKMLKEIADNYNPSTHESPLVIGHPKNDDPAWGWVKKVVFSGKSLFVEPHNVQEQFKDTVKEGRYKKISPAFYGPFSSNNPTPGKWNLKHVGFLGAAAPAVKGLQPVSFGDDQEGILCFEDVKPDKNYADIQAELNNLKNENYVSSLVQSGHVLPREASFVTSFMDTLSQDTYSFSDTNGEHEAEQVEAFKEFLENRPPLVNFSEVYGSSEETVQHDFVAPKWTTVDPEKAAIHASAVARQGSKGISYEDAVREVMSEKR
jgi:hypothetical protein